MRRFVFGLGVLSASCAAWAVEVVDLGVFPAPGYRYAQALSMSDDGKVVGGYASDRFVSPRGWLWTPARGMKPIATRGMRDMWVNAVSGDGKFFAGQGADQNYHYYFYGEVSHPDDYVIFEAISHRMGFPNAEQCSLQDSPMKMSRNGGIIALPAPSHDRKTWGIWLYSVKKDSWQELPTPIKNLYYWALAISADASRVLVSPGDNRGSYLWRSDRPTALKLVMPAGSSGYPRAGTLSDDGQTVLGGAGIDRQWSGFLLSETKGTQWLRFPHVMANGFPTATNQDGTILITRGYGRDVSVWAKPLGYRTFQSLLKPSEIPRGWVADDARDMSASAPIFLIQATVPDAQGIRYTHPYVVRFSSVEELLSR